MLTEKRFGGRGCPGTLKILCGCWGIARKGVIMRGIKDNDLVSFSPIKEENAFQSVVSSEVLLLRSNKMRENLQVSLKRAMLETNYMIFCSHS